MQLKFLSVWVCTIGFIFQPALCFASTLTLIIESPAKIYENHNQFELSVKFYNISDKSFIVFPAYVRRKYTSLDNQNFRYSPLAAPAIDPWPSAIILASGQSKTITFNGMRDGNGVWHLTSGRYKLSVSLHVASTSSFETWGKYKGIDVWRGIAESKSIIINYGYKTKSRIDYAP